MVLRYLTAGESHGPQMTAILSGLPAGLEVRLDDINRQLARRQGGHGRSVRQRIESDAAQLKSGVRHGRTLGAPITIVIENADHQNWLKAMSIHPEDRIEARAITKPRPGHADLVGALKYDHTDARNVLERASARETSLRVAVGALCRALLGEFGIEIISHVTNLGGVISDTAGMTLAQIRDRAEVSPVRMANPANEQQAIGLIDQAKKEGDTLGGIVEVIAGGVPLGLGSCMNWDEKLDGRLAGAICSIQAFKGFEIGAGFAMAGMRGSRVHDPIQIYEGAARPADMLEGHGPAGFFYHPQNNAGGLEGGMTTGEPIVVRGLMKPIATLMKPLKSVDLATLEPFDASRERSDVCALPAAGVVAEAVVAFVLAQAFLEKFGGDSIDEVRRNYAAYCQYLAARSTRKARPGE